MAGILLLGSQAPTLSLTDVPAKKMHQRAIAQTSGPVTLSGTYSGSVSSVEAQILKVSDNSIVKDWTSLSGSSIAGGSWSGTLTGVAQGGSYYAKVRVSNAISVVATGSNGWFMGIVFVCYGQSNMGGFCMTTDQPMPATNAAVVFWDKEHTPHKWMTPDVGNGLVEFLNAMNNATGVPCGAVNGAIAATGITFLSNDSSTDYAPDGGGLWRYYQIMIEAGVIDAEMGLWFQGEADPLTAEFDYKSMFSAMHTKFCTLFGRTKAQFPMMISGLTTYGGSSDALNTDAGWQNIRATLFRAGQQQPNVYFSHSMMDGVRVATDNFHLTGLSFAKTGKRFARTAQYIMGLGGAPAHFEIVSGAVVNGTSTTVTLTLASGATDITPSTGATGFEVSGDNGASWISATAARASATTLTLTHSSIATSSVRKVRYQYGMLPDVSNPVLDNSSLALPLTLTPTQISPAPLSVVPTPVWESQVQLTGTGTVQTFSQSITPHVSNVLFFAAAGNMGNQSGGPATFVATPNVGTAKTVTCLSPVDATASNVSFWRVQFDSDADAAISISGVVTYSTTPFGGNRIGTWSIAAADLSSTTPVDFDAQLLSTVPSTVSTVDTNTSAGGFILAIARSDHVNTSDIVTFSSGDGEAFAMRDNLDSGINTAFGDASNCSANSTNTVIATHSNATTTGQKLALAVLSMR